MPDRSRPLPPIQSKDTVTQGVASATVGVQEASWPTAVTDGDFAANPRFEAGPFDLQTITITIGVGAGVPLGFRDLVISGEFTADLGLVEGRIEGILDVAQDPSPCDLLMSCGPCPDGVGETCSELVVRDIEATYQPGTSIVPRTLAEIAADPDC